MTGVRLRSVAKSFGDVSVLHGIDLNVNEGEFMVFVGPSGCGKSTLLRIVAGLEEATSGEIEIGGECVTDLAPARRGVAMVFQSYALYPHMTVAENMGFALRLAGKGRSEVRAEVGRAAEILRLTELLERKPKALSGGQRQRVAIGRAIVRRPKVFLFDEPLSNLDAALRVQMRLELSRLHKELGATMIYVTHDQVEAMTLGDRIAVFNHGRIEQVGRPLELYERPANPFVAGFLGSPKMNFLRGVPNSERGGSMLTFGGGFSVEMPWHLPAPLEGAPVTVGLRPEHLRFDAAGRGVRGRLELVENLGDAVIAYVQLPDEEQLVSVKVSTTEAGALRSGDVVAMCPSMGHAVVFEADGRAHYAPR